MINFLTQTSHSAMFYFGRPVDGLHCYLLFEQFVYAQTVSRNLSCNRPGQDSDQSDLFHKEVGYKIEKILKSKGHSIQCLAKADYVLAFTMGIKPESVLADEIVLTRDKTVAETTSTKYCKNPDDMKVYASEQTVSSTSVPGTVEIVPKEVVYQGRWLTTHVYKGKEFKKNDGAEQLWEAKSYSLGESDDLRNIVNYLLAANFKYFGERVHKKKDSFSKRNLDVQEIKNAIQ